MKSEVVRVLIADDQPQVRSALKLLLAQEPCVTVVGEATNGQEALRLVEELRPDVVLMDVQMPVMDGLEATGIIKGSWPEIRVIALSMLTSDRTDALAAGADALFTKGCPARTLLEAIQDE